MEHHRNSMTLVNVAYRRPLTWSNRAIVSLEQQALIPLTNTHPVEMGMQGRLDELPQRLREDAEYRRMFAAAFPGEPITVANIAKAIASFERSIVSADSPYDRLVHRGEVHALSDEAWRGRRCIARGQRNDGRPSRQQMRDMRREQQRGEHQCHVPPAAVSWLISFRCVSHVPNSSIFCAGKLPGFARR